MTAFRKALFGLAGVCFALLPPLVTGALAQDDFILEEITVTAQKRTESLIEVPVAITVISSSMKSSCAIALGKDNIDGFPATIQERAYSSPIWFEPAE